MYKTSLLAIALLAAAPAAAQDDRHPVSPDNTWSITDSDCGIDGGWDGDIQMLITRHMDHHDLGIYDPHLKGLVPEKIIPMRYGTDSDPDSAQEYRAIGHKDDGQLSYVSDVDDDLLNRIAAGKSFQVYRGKTLLEDLDMTGFGEALQAARACEVANPQPAEEDDSYVEAQGEAQEDAKTAADEAAADAAAGMSGE